MVPSEFYEGNVIDEYEEVFNMSRKKFKKARYIVPLLKIPKDPV